MSMASKKKPVAKKSAKKAGAKKTAKKVGAKKTAKKAGAKKTPAAPNQFDGHQSVSPASYAWPAHKKSLDLDALAGAYRGGGEATAHPVTGEQMAEVSHDGLRGDDEIRRVDDDKGVAPCRLVDHGEGRYSLCLDDFRMPALKAFHARGLAGNGYTWEALADAVVRLRRPELVTGLSYDSESSMFVAIGTKPTLMGLAHLIQEVIKSGPLLEKAIAAADPDRLE